MDNKVKFFNSIKTRTVFAMVLLAVLAGVVMGFAIIPGVKNNIDETNQGYMKDFARAYGTMLEGEIRLDGLDAALNYDNLSESLEGVGVNGISSSYIYIVSEDGTMLYHPTADKVGQPVENEAVKKTVEKISKHERVDNEVIKYMFKGVEKYAGIYVNDNQNFIVVVTADSDEIFERVNNTVKRGVVGLFLVLIIVVIAGTAVATFIIKPVNQIATLTTKLSNMDFTEDTLHDKLASRKDEIGNMGRALQQLVYSLKQVVNDIKERSNELVNAADSLNTDAAETSTTMEQVESAVNDIAQGATSQADETQQATENIVSMGNMIEDTNNEVNKLLTFTTNMKDTTRQAQDILAELKQVNDKAEEYIDIIAEQTNTTNESALKISEATKLITSIAEETNLLSLNASIEAARAGEQGRGFGVVAAEIQKLAEQSNESAQRIEDIIRELLLDSEKAVETMYSVKEIIRAQSDHVEQTETAFSELTDDMSLSIEGINNIAQKTSMLDEARTNVVDIVQNLTAIAEENAAGTEETSASTAEVTNIVEDISEKSNTLRDVAKQLDDEMNIFKI